MVVFDMHFVFPDRAVPYALHQRRRLGAQVSSTDDEESTFGYYLQGIELSWI